MDFKLKYFKYLHLLRFSIILSGEYFSDNLLSFDTNALYFVRPLYLLLVLWIRIRIRMDPDSMGTMIRIRIRNTEPRGQIWQKNRKQLINFIFWKAGCSLFRSEGFFCSFLTKKERKISAVFFQFSFINTLDPYPDPNAGSGSGSTTLLTFTFFTFKSKPRRRAH